MLEKIRTLYQKLVKRKDVQSREEAINKLIIELEVDTNKISDGYHTFDDLYRYRVELYITLCKLIHSTGYQTKGQRIQIWRSKRDTLDNEIDGWFILGINSMDRKMQITYHIPILRWKDCSFAMSFPSALYFDKHTSTNVLKSLNEL